MAFDDPDALRAHLAKLQQQMAEDDSSDELPSSFSSSQRFSGSASMSIASPQGKQRGQMIQINIQKTIREEKNEQDPVSPTSRLKVQKKVEDPILGGFHLRDSFQEACQSSPDIYKGQEKKRRQSNHQTKSNMFADAFDESVSPPVQKKRTEAGFFTKMRSIIAPKKGSNEDIIIDGNSESLSEASNNFKTMKSTRSTRSKAGSSVAQGMLGLPKVLKSSKKRRKKSVLGIPRDKQYNYALTQKKLMQNMRADLKQVEQLEDDSGSGTGESSHTFESEDLDESEEGSQRKHKLATFSWRQKVLFYLGKLQIKIETTSVVYQLWKVMMIILSFVSSFHYAYYAAFYYEMDDAQRDYIKLLDHIYVALFLMDMLFQIFIDDDHTEKDDQRSFRLSSRFFFDFCSIIPLNRILKALSSIPTEYPLSYLTKVLRLYHGFKLLNYKQFVRQLKAIELNRMKKVQNKPNSRITQLFFLQQVLKTAQLIILLYCISYFTGVFWYILATRHQMQEGFITYFGILDNSVSHNMIALPYFIFTTLSTVGLGDLHPRGDTERVVGAFIMLFGVMITTLMIDNLNLMLGSLNEFNRSYQDFQQLYLFLGIIQKFNDDVPLPDHTVKEYTSYFQYRWEYDRVFAMSSMHDKRIINVLPEETESNLFQVYLFKSFMARYNKIFDIPLAQTFRRQFVFHRLQTRQKEGELIKPDFIKNPCIEAFVMEILRNLEPRDFELGEDLITQDDRVTTMIFPSNFEVHVGFTYRQVLNKLKVYLTKKMTKVVTKKQDINRKVELQEAKNAKKIFDKMVMDNMGGFFKNIMKNTQSKANQTLAQVFWPVSLRLGTPVGLFEMNFDFKSLFHYRVMNYAEASKIRSQNEILRGYFIRQANWRRIFQRMKPMQDWEEVREKWKDHSLINFFEKVYAPIKEFQDNQEFTFQKQKTHKMKKNLMQLMIGTSNKDLLKQSDQIDPQTVNASTRTELLEMLQDNNMSYTFHLRHIVNLSSYHRNLELERQKHDRENLKPRKRILMEVTERLDQTEELMANLIERVDQSEKQAVQMAECIAETARLKNKIKRLQFALRQTREARNILQEQVDEEKDSSSSSSRSIRSVCDKCLEKASRQDAAVQTDEVPTTLPESSEDSDIEIQRSPERNLHSYDTSNSNDHPTPFQSDHKFTFPQRKTTEQVFELELNIESPPLHGPSPTTFVIQPKKTRRITSQVISLPQVPKFGSREAQSQLLPLVEIEPDEPTPPQKSSWSPSSDGRRSKDEDISYIIRSQMRHLSKKASKNSPNKPSDFFEKSMEDEEVKREISNMFSNQSRPETMSLQIQRIKKTGSRESSRLLSIHNQASEEVKIPSPLNNRTKKSSRSIFREASVPLHEEESSIEEKIERESESIFSHLNLSQASPNLLHSPPIRKRMQEDTIEEDIQIIHSRDQMRRIRERLGVEEPASLSIRQNSGTSIQEDICIHQVTDE